MKAKVKMFQSVAQQLAGLPAAAAVLETDMNAFLDTLVPANIISVNVGTSMASMDGTGFAYHAYVVYQE